MKLNRTNVVLAVVLVVVVLLSALVGVDYSRPNFEIALGYDMTYSPASASFTSNAVLPDGRTLQVPVPGTVARGTMPLHFDATPEDAVRAGEQLMNPYDPNAAEGQAAVGRGAEIFRVFCAVCHGGGGNGDGPVASRGYPPPPSMLTGKSLQMKDGQLFHILTYGQANMPSFADQLSPNRRWEVINFIRSLQQRAAQPAQQPAESPDAGSSDTETALEEQNKTPEPTAEIAKPGPISPEYFSQLGNNWLEAPRICSLPVAYCETESQP